MTGRALRSKERGAAQSCRRAGGCNLILRDCGRAVSPRRSYVREDGCDLGIGQVVAPRRHVAAVLLSVYGDRTGASIENRPNQARTVDGIDVGIARKRRIG